MLENFFKNKYAPRWIIFCCDLILVTSAFLLSYFLRHLFLDIRGLSAIVPAVLINVLIFGICVLFFPLYKGIIRYSEINDIFRIIKFAGLQLALWFAIFSLDTHSVITGSFHLPFLIINFFSVIFILVLFRLLIKEVYSRATLSKSSVVSRSIIYGAGEMGQVTKQILEQDMKNKTVVVGFIEDSPSKIGKNLGGLPIYKAYGARLSALLKQKQVTDLYIAIDKLSVEKKIAVSDICSPLNIKINVIPHASEWRGGYFEKKQVKELNIEDLLERDEISLPYDMLQETYKDSTIMVTGAAGSIGSEICRQLSRFTFKKMILLDQSESGLFDLEFELKKKSNQQLRVEVASIRDAAKMKKVFSMHNPDFVFHAAAYKHVPLMETFTSEAVLTNIFGTKVVADLAIAFKVKKFVMVSTDKAVNPSNVMGTTKRISEIYIQSLSDRNDSQTEFITTRFGNVLGSAGSVVRTFNKQIKAGGPITITHPDITRYFMTIPEASKLVLEAGKIGESGDILLFDMGAPVKIMDLAKRMIQLAGLKPTDIAIVQTGLRPGEKMYEELFKDSEEFAETYHPRILRAKKSPIVNNEFSSLMTELREAALVHNSEIIPFILRKMVPEFTSTGALNKVVPAQKLEGMKN
ncbi:MAG: nucleoside-diphosphate sugar epimerase/dehydratase [Ginsengibacter sp.]